VLFASLVLLGGGGATLLFDAFLGDGNGSFSSNKSLSVSTISDLEASFSYCHNTAKHTT
jgi:hypothetical protein